MTGEIDNLVQLADRFSQTATQLEECWSKCGGETIHTDEDKRFIDYYLIMEAALCFYWEAFLSNIVALSQDDPHEFEKRGKTALDESTRLYFHLDRDTRFAGDSILAYRIGNVLTLRGDREIALDKYREAVANLADSTLASDHVMRARIPRYLGISLWEAAGRLKGKAKDLSNPDFFKERRKELYLEAIDVTFPLHKKEIKTGTLESVEVKPAEESRITANNIIEYSLCYLDVGGSWATLAEHGVTEKYLKELLKEVVGSGIDSIARPTVLDTVRAMARYLGDRELATGAAKRVLELSKARDWTVMLSEEVYKEMKRDAEEELQFD